MTIRDLNSERLYVDGPLTAGRLLPLSEDQSHYLAHVLRMGEGGEILLFNGRDGEWRALVENVKKRVVTLAVDRQVRSQTMAQDIHYLFAPLKRSRLDYMVQKATELGVSRLCPVMTQFTMAERVNLERMRGNAIEAAEQCGVLTVPEVVGPQDFRAMLKDWDVSRKLIFCDEDAREENALATLSALKRGPLAVLIGPEGGFSETERALLLGRAFVTRISLGPRVMRADTAAVAALTLVNATLGDWR